MVWEPILSLVRGQLRRQVDEDGCVTCGLTIPSALTWAHVPAGQDHPEKRVYRLYEHDIIQTSEVVAAEDEWARGARPELAPLFRTLSKDVAAGARVARPEVQHKGAQLRAGLTMRRRNAVLKAVATRRRNAVARTGGEHG